MSPAGGGGREREREVTRKRILQAPPLRWLVVGTFLVGGLSAPIRSCLTHEGHDRHGDPESRLVTAVAGSMQGEGRGDGHAESHRLAAHDDPPQAGCSCLGLCQLETAPILEIAGALASASEPPATLRPAPGEVSEPGSGLLDPVALPRAPPAKA